MVDATGSDLRSLSGPFEPAHLYSETAEIDFSPSLSPGGARVAYTTLKYASGELREHTREIATQAIDGSDRRRLTSNDWDDVSPAWSPDGSRIAFVSHREDGPRLFTIAPDGSDERSVASSVQAQTNAPVWSPDGSRLAFVAEEGEYVSLDWVDTYYGDTSKHVTQTANQTIYRETMYTVRADGSDLRKLVWADAPNTAPRTRIGINDLNSLEEDVTTFQWSPDGKQIAFVARYYGEPDGIYVANPDGSGVRRIFALSTTTESEQDHPGWILGIARPPDGSRIIFEAGYPHRWFDRGFRYPVASVYTVVADGSELRLVINKDDLETYLKWPDRIRGTGPRRIVRYIESTGPNVGPEVKGWILSAIAWGGSDEKVLVRMAGDRLVAANP